MLWFALNFSLFEQNQLMLTMANSERLLVISLVLPSCTINSFVILQKKKQYQNLDHTKQKKKRLIKAQAITKTTCASLK